MKHLLSNKNSQKYTANEEDKMSCRIYRNEMYELTFLFVNCELFLIKDDCVVYIRNLIIGFPPFYLLC